MLIETGNYIKPKFCEITYEYQNRLIAFLDILGSTDLIMNLRGPNAIIHIYKQVYECFSEGLKSMKFNYYHTERMFNDSLDKESSKIEDFQISYFSDSVIVSVPLIKGGEKENELIFYEFGSIINLSLMSLFNQGISIRGGISTGLLYHRDNYCIGPALVNAYKLETSDIRPIVKVDKSLDLKFPDLSPYETDNNCYYLSPLTFIYNQARLFEMNMDGKSLDMIKEFTVDTVKRELISTIKSICRLMNNKSKSVRIKGLWLYKHHEILQKVLDDFCELHNLNLDRFKEEVAKFKN
ncbi:hypothetical protein ABWH96_11825 [Marivirga tractuosa]|uniref:hypothetical protein n=1 Tax=Marivirga tractuosa TaxID=1006 RepID=UPI0035CEB99B